jgi:molybdopterin-guanine dinucleotide biosynthesis adapter protein
VKIVAVTGPSQSGKTLLITRLIPEFRSRGLSTAVIKHCGHGFLLDVEGKDSWKYDRAGAGGVALGGPAELAILKKCDDFRDFRELARRYFPEAGIVLVEGGRGVRDLKKVQVVRRGLESDAGAAAGDLVAVVSDAGSVAEVPVFLPDQASELADFLVANLVEEPVDGKEE